ncbi:hypothetical protein Hs30E_10520 [Lactococcus hodotermopsidis]|uniref:Uncharacterized protein n=1 Tax=Pseudolactococcus hodotermopsidis TaxID=2709157 RepID=A0A6A0BDR2_9LACT|nr:hypothetical protein [Lactococcus hodotermopsidis]GFH42501.1 hypothetical protein Hs30E_10520 [Lactococcus hodotermopsidis]
MKMTQNQIKNLCISIFSVFVVGYSLILNFSLIGLAGAAVAVGAIFLIALVYQKDQSVVEKVDLYILLSFLGILAIHYEQLLDAFTTSLFTDGFDRNMPVQIVSLIVGFVVGRIFISNAKKRESLATKTIYKYLGLFLTVFSISLFFWSGVYLTGLAQQLSIFAVFGLIALCRANRTSDEKAIGRVSKVALFLAVFSLVLPVLFPSYSLSQFNINAFLSVTVFPWYSVLGITLLLLSIVGMGLHYGKRRFDEDTIFLSGLVGLAWVVKASVYFYFDFSWIAICVYALLFFGFTNHFIKRNGYWQLTRVDSPLNENEFYWLLIAATSVVFSIFLIHTGYIYFWLSLIVGLLAVLFLNKIAFGWVKDAVFWITLLFSIAGAASTIALQNGYSDKKIITIAAIFVFASIVMWMLNHRNFIGQNKFKTTKIVMVVIFAILVIIPAFKAGSQISVDLKNKSANIGSLVTEETSLLITTTADGKENAVKKLSYIWADSFFFDKEDISELDEAETTLTIDNHHLILWVEDEYGVVTRKDCWFYDSRKR